MFTASAGSGGVNAGEITVNHTTTTANVFLKMLVGTNQSNNASYTVPRGFTGYLVSRYISINRAGSGGVVQDRESTVALWIREFGKPYRLRRPIGISNHTDIFERLTGGFALPEKTDITIRVTVCSNDNTDMSAGYDLILIDNSHRFPNDD